MLDAGCWWIDFSFYSLEFVFLEQINHQYSSSEQPSKREKERGISLVIMNEWIYHGVVPCRVVAVYVVYMEYISEYEYMTAPCFVPTVQYILF